MKTQRRGQRRLGGVLVAASLGVFLSGCAYSLSEFAAEPRQPAVQDATAPEEATGAAMPLREAVLVEDVPAPPPPQPSALAATGSTQPAGDYPNLAIPPGQPTAKLLSPEEKAKIIAELEALAKGQGAATTKVRLQAREACEKALAALDPEDRRKREQEGWKC